MFEYCKSQRTASQDLLQSSHVTESASVNAGRSLAHSFSKIDALKASLNAKLNARSGSTLSTNLRPSTPNDTRPSTPVPMTDAEWQEAAKLQDERDWAAVDDEFDSYIKAGLVTGPEAEDFSLEWHWQVCAFSTVHFA